MIATARKQDVAEFNQMMGKVLGEMGRLFDPTLAERFGNGLLAVFPPDKRMELAARLMRVNPFFQPGWSGEDIARIGLSQAELDEVLLAARLYIHRNPQPNIYIACAPKSASTFISDTLVKATGLPQTILFSSAHQPTHLAANLREQEPDELAIILNGLNGIGYVTQQHVRPSERLIRLMQLYRIRPVVTWRNLFDTLISMDDMIHSHREGVDPAHHYFTDGMPADFYTMDFEDRITLLSARWTAWLISFRTGWAALADHPLKPVVISYERDLQGDRAVLAERLARELGGNLVDPVRLAACLVDESKGAAVRINKGVVGRGAAIPARIRTRIETMVRTMADRRHWDGLIGEG